MSERPNPLLSGALGSYDGGVRVIPHDPADRSMADALSRMVDIATGRSREWARRADLDALAAMNPNYLDTLMQLPPEQYRALVEADWSGAENASSGRAIEARLTPRQAALAGAEARMRDIDAILKPIVAFKDEEIARLKAEVAELRREREAFGWSNNDAPTLGGPLAAPTQETRP